MPDKDTQVSLGAAKIVKLGNDTVLIVEVVNADNVPEGEYTVKAINASPTGPAGAGDCVVQIN